MATQNPDLLKQAEELSITVNARWSDETLQKKIDEALAGAGTDQKPDPDGDEEGAENPPTTPDKGEKFGGKGDHDGNGKTGGAAPAKKGTVYTLKRAYWDKDGNRIEAGSDVTLDDNEARRLGRDVLEPKSVL